MYNNCVSSIALKEGGYTKEKKGFIKTSVINCEVPTQSIPSKKVSLVTVKYESILHCDLLGKASARKDTPHRS